MSVVASEATLLRGPIEVDDSQPTGRLRRRGSRSDTGAPAAEMPGARALAAMAEAARRAQEGPTPTAAGQTARVPKTGLARRDRRRVRPSDGRSPLRSEGAASPSLGSTAEGNGDSGVAASPEDRRERRLFASVLVTAALVVVAALALAFVLGAHQNVVTTLHSAGTAVPSGHTTSPTRGLSGPARARSRAPRSSVSGPGTATTGTAPLLSSLSPSTGGFGQQVTVSGTDFLSADGEIVAHFGGQSAATSCPSQTLCLVTVVPPLSGSPRSVPVSISTEAGTSATLTFDYF
jgi:IPT/TIG domain